MNETTIILGPRAAPGVSSLQIPLDSSGAHQMGSWRVALLLYDEKSDATILIRKAEQWELFKIEQDSFLNIFDVF